MDKSSKYYNTSIYKPDCLLQMYSNNYALNILLDIQSSNEEW